MAKSYKPNAAKDGLEETTITQLTYPLTNHDRQPMPAGGLFSTASDVARFCQMVFNAGSFEGKRVLSEEAVKQMTSRQTGAELRESYGFGWAINGTSFGHGGAFATSMNIEPVRGLITVWMVQHAGFPGEGKKSQDAFKQAAFAAFAQ